MIYLLEVRKGDERERHPFEATSDDDAQMRAIPIILDKAVRLDIWAKGHIVLKTDEGRIVNEMEEKP